MFRVQATALSRLVFMAGFFAASAANVACAFRCLAFDYASAPWSAAVELPNGAARLSFASFTLEGRYQLIFPISWNMELSWHDFSNPFQFAASEIRIDAPWGVAPPGTVGSAEKRLPRQWLLNEFPQDPRMRGISQLWVRWLDQPDPSNRAFVEALKTQGFTEQEIARWASSMRQRDAWLLHIPAYWIGETFEGLPTEQ